LLYNNHCLDRCLRKECPDEKPSDCRDYQTDWLSKFKMSHGRSDFKRLYQLVDRVEKCRTNDNKAIVRSKNDLKSILRIQIQLNMDTGQ
jgi:hypothetical protein